MHADRGSRLRRWSRYFAERSPLPMLLLVGGGISASASFLIRASLDVGAATLSAIGIVGLLMLLRMMDEIKDVAKDGVAHPERPLPRGLVSVQGLRRALRLTVLLLFAYAALVGIARGAVAGTLYAATIAYSLLMYREFFVSALLTRNQLAYAVTHQLILLPIYLFAVAMVAPAHVSGALSVWFAVSGLGASFTYEMSRKLDPDALPVLHTYLQVHGRGVVVTAIIAALALLALSTARIGVEIIVWPAIALLLIVLPLIYLSPRRFRIVEGTAALVMIAQMFAPTLQHTIAASR